MSRASRAELMDPDQELHFFPGYPECGGDVADILAPAKQAHGLDARVLVHGGECDSRALNFGFGGFFSGAKLRQHVVPTDAIDARLHVYLALHAEKQDARGRQAEGQ
jgi:hypothetical protein